MGPYTHICLRWDFVLLVGLNFLGVNTPFHCESTMIKGLYQRNRPVRYGISMSDMDFEDMNKSLYYPIGISKMVL